MISNKTTFIFDPSSIAGVSVKTRPGADGTSQTIVQWIGFSGTPILMFSRLGVEYEPWFIAQCSDMLLGRMMPDPDSDSDSDNGPELDALDEDSYWDFMAAMKARADEETTKESEPAEHTAPGA